MTKEDAQKELVRLLKNAAPQLNEYATEQWKVLKQETESNEKVYVNV